MNFFKNPDFIDKPRIEKQKWFRVATEHIHHVIAQLRANNRLLQTRFHFIHVNYYCFIENKGYVPCEISVSEFCILNGVTRTWHRFINPGGNIPVGYGSEVNDHKEETHKLSWPLPLEAGAKPLREVYLELIHFVRNKAYEDIWPFDVPPLFTLNYNEKFVNIADNERIVTDVLNLMCAQYGTKFRFSVYPAVKLYNELLNSCALCVGRGHYEPLDMSQKEMEKDIFQNRQSLACKYHISLDAIEHCSRSFVLRWSYTVLGECCPILNIPMLNEKHKPLASQVTELPEVVVDAYWVERRVDKRGHGNKNMSVREKQRNEKDEWKFVNESPKKKNESEKSLSHREIDKKAKSSSKSSSDALDKDDDEVFWEWEKPVSRNRINITPLEENHTNEQLASSPKAQHNLSRDNRIEYASNRSSNEDKKLINSSQERSSEIHINQDIKSFSNERLTSARPNTPTVRKPNPETLKEAIRTCRSTLSLMIDSNTVEPEYFAVHNNYALPYKVTKSNVRRYK